MINSHLSKCYKCKRLHYNLFQCPYCWQRIKSTDTISSVKAIKTFFEQDGGAKVSVSELKELSPEERRELGKLTAGALGKTVEVK